MTIVLPTSPKHCCYSTEFPKVVQAHTAGEVVKNVYFVKGLFRDISANFH